MKPLTNNEIAETANVLLAQVNRADLRVTYAGNGWFHRSMHGMATASKERRKDVLRTIENLHKRIARESAERPELERRKREERARYVLHAAAPKMLAALQATAEHFENRVRAGDLTAWDVRETVIAAIAEATAVPVTAEEFEND